jgi:hypothetical protein
MLPIHQAQVSLVHQSRGLEQVFRAFATHVIRGQAAQFTIDDWYQLVERGLISATPLGKQVRDFSWTRHPGNPLVTDT